jgi:hypothetical protein
MAHNDIPTASKIGGTLARMDGEVGAPPATPRATLPAHPVIATLHSGEAPMHERNLLSLAVLVTFGVACSDSAPQPTEPAGIDAVSSHFPGHDPGSELELTLAAPDSWSGATLTTSETCGWTSVIAENDDLSMSAGVQDVVDGNDVRFELLLTGVEHFGPSEVCLGNVRPKGDWRKDLIIDYRQRGRNPPEIFVVWHFQHDGQTHDLRSGWTRIENTWNEIVGGATVRFEGQATIRQERTTVASGVPLAFDFVVDQPGNGGDDPPPPPSEPLQASFTYDCGNGSSCSFTDTSTGGPTGWSWSFPGGTPDGASTQNASTTYSSEGDHTAMLEVSNADGSDTTERTITCRQQGPHLRCR